MSSFLDSTGLSHLISKIKDTFVAKAGTTAVTSVGIDSMPTANSTNLVTSGGVYSAIQNGGGGGSSSTPVTVVSGSTVTQQLSPNTHYVFGCVDSLTITLGSPTSDIVNEYSFEFDSGNTATALTLPSNVEFEADTTPTTNNHYEINIKYNQSTGSYFGLISSWFYIHLPDNSILLDRVPNSDSDESQTGNISRKSKNYSYTNGVDVYYYNTSTNVVDKVTNKAYSDGTNLTVEYGYQLITISTAANPETFTDVKREGAPCFAVNTNITLADGSKKKIQDIEYTDDLLVWDFDAGKLASAKPLWITKKLETTHYHTVYLSDGTILKLIGTVSYHRLYDVDNGCFTPSVDMVGKKTIKEDGTIVEVLSWEDVVEPIEYYNIITDYHMNCYAEGVLTSCRYSNMYPISADMKYIKDNRQLISYEDFEGKIEKRYYNGLRVGEQLFETNAIVSYCNNMVKYRKENT